MSINVSKNTDVILNKVVNQILGGYQTDALARLAKCGHFSDEQITKVQEILTETGGANFTHSATLPIDLKSRLLFALYPEANQFYAQLHKDIISHVYEYSRYEDKVTGLRSLVCVSKHFYKHITELVDLKFKEISSQVIILDARALGIELDDEPPTKKQAVIKCIQDMAPLIEEHEGVTLLTVPKNYTLNQLVKIAELAGIKGNAWRQILIDIGEIPVKHTYRVIISNNIFINTRGESCDDQRKFVQEKGCDLPSVQEYALLCIFTQKLFNRCLYGRDRLIFGRSSSYVNGHSVVIGGFTAHQYSLLTYHFLAKLSGAGGRRKV